MTQHIGIIGYPLKHSISPDFQQAALDYYRLDVRYDIWETEINNLPSIINQLRQPHNIGANVTVPYKEAVLGLVDEVDGLASLIGAVNTIVNQSGKLVGFNTDTHGFLKALKKDARFELKNKRVVILGAGGAARAVCFALIQGGAGSVAVVNRTLARAEALVGSLVEYTVGNNIQTNVIAFSQQGSKFREVVRNSQLVINCTTLGMKYSLQEEQSPLIADLISKGALVYDLVYNPSETPLLRMARGAGAEVLGGLAMLVYQGAVSFELWMGKEAPVDIMFMAAKQALSEIGEEM